MSDVLVSGFRSIVRPGRRAEAREGPRARGPGFVTVILHFAFDIEFTVISCKMDSPYCNFAACKLL